MRARLELIALASAILIACRADSAVDLEAAKFGLPAPFVVAPDGHVAPSATRERLGLIGAPHLMVVTHNPRASRTARADAKVDSSPEPAEVERWEFDRQGRALSMSGTRRRHEYEYDDAGRLVTRREREGEETWSYAYRYDDADRVVHEVWTSPRGEPTSIDTAYESPRRFLRTWKSQARGERTIVHDLNAEGRTVLRTWSTGKTERTRYDRRGRVTAEVSSKEDETRTTRYAYRETASSVTLEVVEPSGRKHVLTKDARGNRLLDAAYEADGSMEHEWSYSYEFDEVGNWTVQRRHAAAHDESPASTRVTTREFEYWE